MGQYASSSAVVSSPRDKTRLEGQVDRLGALVERCERQVAVTGTISDRIVGGMETKGSGNPPSPVRIALLGSIDELLDRLTRVLDEQESYNQRLNEAL